MNSPKRVRTRRSRAQQPTKINNYFFAYTHGGYKIHDNSFRIICLPQNWAEIGSFLVKKWPFFAPNQALQAGFYSEIRRFAHPYETPAPGLRSLRGVGQFG